MFSDLPPIDIDYEYASPDQTLPQSVCQTFQPHSLREAPCSYEFDPYFSGGDQRPHIDMPAIVPLGCGGNSVRESARWGHDRTKPLWTLAPYVMQGDLPSYPSWPSTTAVPGRASSISSFAEESSLSEDGSYTPSGIWSPVTTKGGPCGSQKPQLPRYYSELWTGHGNVHPAISDPGSSPPLASTSHNDECCGSGIALQDVQQYPDSYPEEHFCDSSEVEAKVSCPFSFDLLDTQIRSEHLTEDRGASLDRTLSEADGTKEESMSEEDQERTSDYVPQSHAIQIVTRPSRLPNATAKHVNKVSVKIKRRSKTGKAAKRSAKADSASDTIVLSTTGKTTCPHCSQTLHSKSALNKHITTAHTRPFTCTFRIYGCLSTFGSKNEWKRHVSSQHLRLGFWRCNLEQCLPRQQADTSDEEVEELIFNDFNRKDLFTQHLRRMHSPPPSSSAAEKAEFNTSLENVTRNCFMAIRNSPPRSVCGFCNTNATHEVAFEGQGAWEARMEHVGRHLESGHGRGGKWVEDQGLKDWLVSEGLIEGNDKNGWWLVGLQNDERARKT